MIMCPSPKPAEWEPESWYIINIILIQDYGGIDQNESSSASMKSTLTHQTSRDATLSKNMLLLSIINYVYEVTYVGTP